MTYEQEVEFFNQKVKEMADVFARKRNDYGATTTETFEKFGPVSMLTRMHDKLGRLDNLLVYQNGGIRETMVATESIEDTLTDLANYAIITILELHKWNKKVSDVRRL